MRICVADCNGGLLLPAFFTVVLFTPVVGAQADEEDDPFECAICMTECVDPVTAGWCVELRWVWRTVTSLYPAFLRRPNMQRRSQLLYAAPARLDFAKSSGPPLPDVPGPNPARPRIAQSKHRASQGN